MNTWIIEHIDPDGVKSRFTGKESSTAAAWEAVIERLESGDLDPGTTTVSVVGSAHLTLNDAIKNLRDTAALIRLVSATYDNGLLLKVREAKKSVGGAPARTAAESAEIRERARRMRTDDPGISMREIGRQLGISPMTAAKYVQQ